MSVRRERPHSSPARRGVKGASPLRQPPWLLAEILRVNIAKPCFPCHALVSLVVANVEAQVCRVSPCRFPKRIQPVGNRLTRSSQNPWIRKSLARIRRRHNHYLTPGCRQGCKTPQRHRSLGDRRTRPKMVSGEYGPVAIEADQYAHRLLPVLGRTCHNDPRRTYVISSGRLAHPAPSPPGPPAAPPEG